MGMANQRKHRANFSVLKFLKYGHFFLCIDFQIMIAIPLLLHPSDRVAKT